MSYRPLTYLELYKGKVNIITGVVQVQQGIEHRLSQKKKKTKKQKVLNIGVAICVDGSYACCVKVGIIGVVSR